MRRPKIYSDFELTNKIGLSNYLSGQANFEDILQPTGIADLDFISAGPVPPNPSELLMNDLLPKLIQEALKKYRYVFIDSPPIALVTDAMSIAQYVDHTIFIVRQNYTERGYLRSIQDYYETDRLKNVSVVLNDIYKTGPGYGYGYNYGYNYSYGYGTKRKSKTSAYYEE